MHFLSFISCKSDDLKFFYDFFNFWHVFLGQKPSKNWHFLKRIQTLKLLSKSHSTPSKTHINVFLPYRKPRKDSKPATKFAVVSYIYRKKSSFVCKTNSGISAARSAARIPHLLYRILMRIQENYRHPGPGSKSLTKGRKMVENRPSHQCWLFENFFGQ